MKKTFLFNALLFSIISLNAQSRHKKNFADTANKLILTIDYDSATIKNTLQPGNFTQKIRPKVGSYISIRVIHLPKDFSASGNVEFANGNLEGADFFTSFYKPDSAGGTGTNNISSSSALPTPDPESVLQEEEKKIDIESQKRIDELQRELNKGTKIKIEKLIESFLNDKKIIGDSLFSKPATKALLEKAQIDYNSQKRLIVIAQKNIKQKMDLKDSLIKIVLHQKDSVVAKKNESRNVQNTNNKIFDIQVPNSDISNINIVLKNNNKQTIAQIPLSYYNRAGYKIDFSTGFFFNQLQDQEYVAVNKQTDGSPISTIDTIYQLKQKDNGKGKIAIGILAHYYARWFKYFNLAVSGGFSYQADNRIINYMLGTSTLFGNQQRFIVSAGLALGRVRELDTKFFSPVFLTFYSLKIRFSFSAIFS
jgi:hypothetical protein